MLHDLARQLAQLPVTGDPVAGRGLADGRRLAVAHAVDRERAAVAERAPGIGNLDASGGHGIVPQDHPVEYRRYSRETPTQVIVVPFT